MCVYIAAASGPNGPNEGRLLELLKLRGSNIFGSGMDYPRAKYRTRMCPLNSRVSDRACPREKKKVPMPMLIGSGIRGYPNPWAILPSLHNLSTN